MKTIITGATGFVGKNLSEYLFKRAFSIQGLSLRNSNWKSEMDINASVIVHLAGKAHDLKKTANDKEYYEINFELTKNIYDEFLESNAKKFIYFSSVKAVKDVVEGVLKEDNIAEPITPYGKSKRMAEEYILSNLPEDKSVYILRPCMIHGPENKGNLNLLYNIINKGIPYPLASYNNKRSFLSVDNLCFVIEQILVNDIPSGIYHLADDEALSTNELVLLIGENLSKKVKLWRIPKAMINLVAKVGDIFKLPLNSERLQKMTENYEVSNSKIVEVIGKPFPLSSKEGLIRTFKSFNKK